MDNIMMPWITLLLATMPSWTFIDASLWDCKDSSDCDPKEFGPIKFSLDPYGPDNYLPPGPITLRCDATGDLQYIRWRREGADKRTDILNSSTFTELSSSQWKATLDNYLLRDNFPYEYRCIAFGKCCKSGSIGVSKIKTVKINPTDVLQDQVCFKDTLIILDSSGSVGHSTFHITFKQFVYSLVDDKRLNVSQNGSHIAIMTFSEKEKLELSFAQGYNATFIKAAVKEIPYRIGGRTRTDLALGLANEIFTKKEESNRQFHHNDVIVLVTDGVPTFEIRAITEARKLQKKGVTIIVVLIGYDQRYYRYLEVMQDISTSGELIFATIIDLRMTVDRVVDGICKKRATVPGKPRNVGAVVNGNAIKVSWIPPRKTHNDIIYYTISWKNLKEPNTIINQTNVTSYSCVIEVSSPGQYYIYIKAVNHVGIGEAVIELVEVTAQVDATTSVVISTPTILIPTTSIQTTYPPGKMPADKKSNIDKVAVACGVTGSVVFLVLIVVGFFKWKMMRRKEHDRSVREFQALRENHYDGASISKSATQELVPLNKKTESVPESLSYVTLLEEWGISPKKP